MRHVVLQGARFDCGITRARQLVLRLRGTLTPLVAAQLCGQIQALYRPPASIVVDIRDAPLAMSFEALNHTPDDLHETFRTLPIAVVTERDRELMRAHAWEAAKLGLLRGVFADPLSAQDWAVREQASNQALYSRISKSA